MNKQFEFIIFWIAILFLIIISFTHDRLSKKNQKGLVFFFILIFCFMYSYRTLGMDVRNYIQAYEYFTIERLQRRLQLSSLFSYEYEPLYFFMLFISKKFFLSFQQCQFILYFVSTLIFYHFMCKKTNYPLIAYFVFMLEMMFHYDLTRFFVAMSFLCIGFYSNKKIQKYIFYCIAFCFHYSSIFLLLLELLAKFNAKTQKKYLLYMIIIFSCLILKFVDLSVFETSSFKFLFKIQYYITHADTAFLDLPIMRILYILINVYPIFMCKRLITSLSKVENISEKDKKMIIKIKEIAKIGIVVSLSFVLFFQTYQLSFRIMLLSYFTIFIPLTNIVGDNIKNGKISRNALRIIKNLFIFDILMSFYYIGISIVY